MNRGQNVLGSPARKALYLMARRKLNVRKAADSLAAFQGAACQGRYPLDRISRVLATQHVSWAGDAISACLTHGICIIFVDSHGTWRGTCEPPVTVPSPVTELLDELVADSRWPQVFDNFMRHLRSRVLRDWIKELGEDALPKSERSTWMRCYVYRGEPPVALRYDFRGLLRGLIESRLHEQGVRARYCLDSANDLDLAEHICTLVYGQIVMRAGSLQLHARTAGTAIRLFETEVASYDATINRALEALQRLLIKRSRQWH